jgi:hypothetical protein
MLKAPTWERVLVSKNFKNTVVVVLIVANWTILIKYRAVLTRKELKDIVQARLDDADALHVSGRYDGAIYPR